MSESSSEEEQEENEEEEEEEEEEEAQEEEEENEEEEEDQEEEEKTPKKKVKQEEDSKPPPKRKVRTWSESYQALAAYHSKHGTLQIPRNVDAALQRWVLNQRSAYCNLDKKQKNKLDAIGLQPADNSKNGKPGKRNDTLWNEKYEELKAYKSLHGNCNVPSSKLKDREYRKLGKWLENQRQLHKKGTLTAHREEKLNQIGIKWQVWTYVDEKSQKPAAATESNMDNNGKADSDVENSEEEAPDKSSAKHKKGDKQKASPVKVEESKQHKSPAKTKKKKAYSKDETTETTPATNDNSRNPESRVKGKKESKQKTTTSEKLKSTKKQKSVAKLSEAGKKKATPKQKEKSKQPKSEVMSKKDEVSEIASDSSKEKESRNESRGDKLWNERYNKLVEFHRDHGHIEVTKDLDNEGRLNIWINEQRRLEKKNLLRPDRIELLTELGMVWGNKIAEEWSNHFDQLCKYKEEHGNANVPELFTSDDRLGKWYVTQRRQLKKGDMQPSRAKQIIEFGFPVPDESQQSWIARYRKLQALLKLKSKCEKLDPEKWLKNMVDLTKECKGLSLERWTELQRVLHAAEKLSEDRKEMLDNIGFRWIEDRGSAAMNDEENSGEKDSPIAPKKRKVANDSQMTTERKRKKRL